MKRGEGVPREQTDRLLRDLDRELRSLTAAAAERVLQTASPGLGGSVILTSELREMGFTLSRQFEMDLVYGCSEDGCGCDQLAENWTEVDQYGEELEWVYRRAGRWRVLEADGWDRDTPRRAWQYDYWRIEDARSGDGTGADQQGVPGAVDGG